MPIITSSPGIDLNYSDLNPSGYPAVTLLHGLGANSESWAFQIPQLYGMHSGIKLCRLIRKGTERQRALARFDITAHLMGINKETLVITGDKDRTVSPETQRYPLENIPQARQVIISGAGHGVTGEKPEEFNQELLKFLSEQSV